MRPHPRQLSRKRCAVRFVPSRTLAHIRNFIRKQRGVDRRQPRNRSLARARYARKKKCPPIPNGAGGMHQKLATLRQHQRMHDPKNGIQRIRIHGLPNPSPPCPRIPLRQEIPPAHPPHALPASHLKFVIRNIGILGIIRLTTALALAKPSRSRFQQFDIKLNQIEWLFVHAHESHIALFHHLRKRRASRAQGDRHAADLHHSRMRGHGRCAFQNGSQRAHEVDTSGSASARDKLPVPLSGDASLLGLFFSDPPMLDATYRATRTNPLDRASKAAAHRVMGDIAPGAATQSSPRRTPASTPKILSTGTAGSARGMESPRVTNLPGNLSAGRATMRCRKKRPHRSYKTISPTFISDGERLSIATVSPGHSVGSILLPETRMRHRPCWRNTSTINSCFRPPSTTFISNLGVLPRAEMALPFHPAHFAAGKA